MMPFKNKRLRPFLLIAVALLIIFIVSAHVFGVVFLVGAFSLHRPILYVLIGLVIGAVVLFKFKHVLGHVHRRKENK